MFSRAPKLPKCQHKWETKGWCVQKEFKSNCPGPRELPISQETHITLVCSICGDVNRKRYNGYYSDPRG